MTDKNDPSGRLPPGSVVTLAHGSGGKAMRNLIETVFVRNFENPLLAPLEDQARIPLEDLCCLGDRLAFTTDSFVVDPLFFPGGDIGSLAVYGTVNDLAMSGARPLYLSCGFIIEEGLELNVLHQVVHSMREAAKRAGVAIVTGDTKVVNRGSADKLFVNTAGIGVIPPSVHVAAQHARPGDVILINGSLGNHGAAILSARGDLGLEVDIQSDCAPLHDLVKVMLAACPDVHAMRDATRGGVAAVLNEFAETASVGVSLDEASLPVHEEIRGVCELLGLDPLYLANEAKLVAAVPKPQSAAVLAAMRAHPAGREAAIIGEVLADPKGLVILRSAFGGERIVDRLVGEPLPRIC
ncbi:MAG: hydrogenase expression/formation protein HypE [Gammaproteobacteria bacterium]|jgi:hydrogenase expression/formation protein HypE